MTTRTAGPDYWFLDPNKIDRLTEDECPIDLIEEAADREWLELEVDYQHSAKCFSTLVVGIHSANNCPKVEL